MKSVLTGELAEKRKRIAKRHNFLLLAGFPIVASAILLAFSRIQFPPHSQYPLPLFFGTVLVVEGFGLYLLLQYDQKLCRQMGFMCPQCGKPLYEPRALLWNTLCPKCGKDIVDK